jgi:hypothetical protein
MCRSKGSPPGKTLNIPMRKITVFISKYETKQLIRCIGIQPRQYPKTPNTISTTMPVVIAFQTGNTLGPFSFFKFEVNIEVNDTSALYKI